MVSTHKRAKGWELEMFTGLIEDTGRIERVRRKGHAAVLTVQTHLPLRTMPRGASVAVNGICLTIVKKSIKAFTVDVSPETLKRTSLQTLKTGSLVNLERPMQLQDRLGGHLVTGHVDGAGVVDSIEHKGEFMFFTIAVPSRIGLLLVTKGSVAVDGISLTVNDCSQRRFSVAIIPFTLNHTNLRVCRVGDKVNVETDLIGKYVYKFLKITDLTRGRRKV
jgi:riboflavin synthase